MSLQVHMPNEPRVECMGGYKSSEYQEIERQVQKPSTEQWEYTEKMNFKLGGTFTVRWEVTGGLTTLQYS